MREELDNLAAALPPDAPVRISKTTDPMDDHPILTLTVGAVHVEGAKAYDRPVLVLRANKRGVEIRHDAYVHVGERFFFRKGKDIGMRIRLDEAEPFSVKTSLSTNLGAVFAEVPERIICAAANCSRLKVQIIPEHGAAVLAIFDFELVRPAIDLFLKAVLGPDSNSICKVNPEVLHWCLIMGPKNTYIKKLALKERGFDPGPLDYVKRYSFFEAAERYAHAKQTSEITGNITDLGWTSHLYKDTSESIRAAMGPLTINN